MFRCSLAKDLLKLHIVLIATLMMDSNVPTQVVRSRKLALPVGTEWAYVSRATVNQTMPYQIGLAFEAFSALASWASLRRAIVWPVSVVYIVM